MRVLVTGGAGYLGSHTVTTLLDAGHSVLVLDSLVSSSEEPLRRAARVCGAELGGDRLDLVRADVRRPAEYRERVLAWRPDAVVHFAGLKSPTESLADPGEYYAVNVGGTAELARVTADAGARVLLFSSSATVYGDDAPVPVDEDAPLAPVSPYGRSKAMAEQVLADAHAAAPAQTVAVLEWMAARPAGEAGLRVWNIGRGEGVTVFEMVRAFEQVTGRRVPHRVVGRRPGDIAESCADVAAIGRDVGWRARRDVTDMVRDLWAWQAANPAGYR